MSYYPEFIKYLEAAAASQEQIILQTLVFFYICHSHLAWLIMVDVSACVAREKYLYYHMITTSTSQISCVSIQNKHGIRPPEALVSKI